MAIVADFSLPAVAALEQAPALVQAVDAAISAAGPEGLRIDASALAEFDTSAVALLLHAQRSAQAQGKALQVVGAPAKLSELARLYGVDGLLPLVPPCPPVPPPGGAPVTT